MDKNCIVCGKTFHAKRATAKFCSAKCRVAYNRDVSVEVAEDKSIIIKAGVCPACSLDNYNPDDEWSHSACLRSQEDIENHYTLRTFPKAKYGTAGATSPYRKTDGRSVAYFDS